MVNLASVLLQLCKPFMDTNSDKVQSTSWSAMGVCSGAFSSVVSVRPSVVRYILARECFVLTRGDFSSFRQMNKIDPRYTGSPRARVNFREETRMAVKAPEAVQWVAQNGIPPLNVEGTFVAWQSLIGVLYRLSRWSVEPAEPYNFICECFFMTIRCMQLGTRRLMQMYTRMNEELHRRSEV